MINEHWTVLGEEKTRKFIAEVRDPDFAELFDGPDYELWGYPLEFFDGYWRYSLNNTSVIPYFSMDYISNGENHYYLDGSEHPIALLLRRDALRLTAENVLDYLDFFDDVVFDPARKVKFIVDAYDTGYAGASAMEHHFKAINYTAQRQIKELEDHFLLTLPALCDGQTVQATVRVNKTGEVFVLSPLYIDLMARTYDALQPLRYKHAYEQALLEKNVAILDRAPTAARMVDFTEQYGVRLRVLSGVVDKGTWSDGKSAFITVPAYVEQDSPYQVLGLAMVMREAELCHIPRTPEEQAELAKMSLEERQYGQNLDVLLGLCRIVEELDASGYPLALEKFRKTGFEALFTGYKNGLSPEQLLDVFADLVETKEK